MFNFKIPVPGCILVPRDAYKFWPDNNYICSGSGKKSIRHIFEFQVLSDFENEKLSRLEGEIKDQNLDGLKIPASWSRNHLLRFCYGTGWKTRSATKALLLHLKWREEKMPNGYEELYPKVYHLLNSGAFYIAGRDSMFRPLIIMNLPKIDFKTNTIDEYTDMLIFLLDYVVDHMLLPGQVENWVVLIDLGKKGLGNLSVNSLKQVLTILQVNYRCRLGMNYIVNPPKSIWMLWSCIKPFLDDVTIEKIKIANSSNSSELLSTANPYMIEEKYGGRAPNMLNYWPPNIPDLSYAMPGQAIRLSTKDSYSQFHPVTTLNNVCESKDRSPSPQMKIRSKVNSLDVSLEHSEMSIEDLENDNYGRSDVENQDEVLIEFEDLAPFNRNGEKSPEKLKIGIRPLEELLLRSGQKVVQDTGEFPKEDNVLVSFSPSNKENFKKMNEDFCTPKKKSGPPPIGIIIERDDRFGRCSRIACCDNVSSNCSIY